MRAVDLAVYRAIHLGFRHPVLDAVMAFFSYAGLGFAPAALCVALLAMPRSRRCGGVMAIALVVGALLFANLAKGIFGRERPSNLAFAIPQEPLYAANSFPSGHTATGFAVAAALWVAPPGSRYDRLWRILGTVYALGVGLSRITRGVHWPTDVLGGACVGVLTACLVALVWRPKESVTASP